MTTLLNLFYIFSGLLGFTTVLIISIRYKTNSTINIYLLLIFSLLSVKFLVNGLYGIEGFFMLKNFDFFYSSFLTVVIPAFYLYFKNLVADNKTFNVKELKHFILPLLIGSTLALYDKFYFLTLSSQWIYFCVFFLFILFYLNLCFQVLRKNVWFRKTDVINVKDQNKVLKYWTSFLFIVCCLVCFRLIIALIIGIKVEKYAYGQNYLWVSVILFDLIFFKILNTPEILYGYNAIYKKIKSHHNYNYILNDLWIHEMKGKIVNSQDLSLHLKIAEFIPFYLLEIENLVLKKEILRNPVVAISDISNKLEIPKSHITFVFKYHSKVSFIDFKKILRIHDAVDLIEKDYLKSNTLDSLAAKVGFSSYNPFFISFKEITGTTPQLYSKVNSKKIKKVK